MLILLNSAPLSCSLYLMELFRSMASRPRYMYLAWTALHAAHNPYSVHLIRQETACLFKQLQTYLSRCSLMVPATELSSPSRHTYQAGILWPHHSCRLMHQSLMLSSHLQ